MNRAGAIAGILVGLIFTFLYIVYFVFMGGDKADYLFGIAPTGIGTIGMILHFIVALRCIESYRTTTCPYYRRW